MNIKSKIITEYNLIKKELNRIPKNYIFTGLLSIFISLAILVIAIKQGIILI